MEEEKLNPEQAYKTLMIIWFAILMSHFMFVVMIYFVKPELFQFDLSGPILGKNPTFVLAMAAIAILSLTTSFALKKKFLSQAVAEQKLELVQTANVVGFALAEVSSLLGVVLAFTFDFKFFFAFSAFGIIGTLLHFPKTQRRSRREF